MTWKTLATKAALIWFLLNVCSAMFNKLISSVNALSLWQHWYNFSLVSQQMTKKIYHYEKKYCHICCIKNVTPQWESIMTFKMVILCESLVIWLHWYGLSPVWILIWILRPLLCMKVFATLVALIWSLPSMNSHMHLKTITLRDSFATLVALIWSLPSMNSHMHFKANHLWESFVTLVVFIWSLPSANPFMHFKTIILCKYIVTLAALVWSFLNVTPHMDFKTFI